MSHLLSQQFQVESLENLKSQAKIPFTIVEEKDFFQTFAQRFFQVLENAHTSQKALKLIIPVGPRGQYPLLAKMLNASNISLKNVHLFFMDEYLDWEGRELPDTDPLAFSWYMKNAFFSQLKKELQLNPQQIYFPKVQDLDFTDKKIQELGGIDICFGGVGIHGHVAFNEPPLSRFWQVTDEEFANSRTRIVPLAPETITMNAARANGSYFAKFPYMAVTLGMKAILESKEIHLFCDGGSWQRTAMRMAFFGKVTQAYPVSFLQNHKNAHITLTKDTAAPLV